MLVFQYYAEMHAGIIANILAIISYTIKGHNGAELILQEVGAGTREVREIFIMLST